MVSKYNPTASTGSNIAYNIATTLATMVIPFFTFPYVSRVLGPEYLGRVNFFASLASYFVVIAYFGVPTHATRMVARLRNDHSAVSKFSSNVLLIAASTSFVSFWLYGLVLAFVPGVRTDIPLFLVYGLQILVVPVSTDWAFQGYEAFRPRAIRIIAVKVLTVAALFILVRSPRDYLTYAAIPVVGFLLEAAITITYSKRFFFHVGLRYISRTEVFGTIPRLLSALLIGVVSTSFTTIDKVMLGVLSTDTNVGYYVPADRLIRMLSALSVAVSNVIFPRAAHSLHSEGTDDFEQLQSRTLSLFLLMGLPLVVGVAFLGGDLIRLFAGLQYAQSVPTLQILSPLILIESLGLVFGLQILYLSGKEIAYILTIVMAIVAAVLLNLVFIPQYGAPGAAIATTLSGTVSLAAQMVFARKVLRNLKVKRSLFTAIGGTALVVLLLVGAHYLTPGLQGVYKLLVLVPASIALYIFFLLLTKEQNLIGILNRARGLKSKTK